MLFFRLTSSLQLVKVPVSMFVIDSIILLAAVLILLGIASSKISARLGLPVLVLFLFVGMIAGEQGIGGITFDNAEVAHALGTIALALILYDGGLQTQTSAIRAVWKPASILATLGVLGTALVTGFAAHFILGLSVLEGLLVGAIVGSTDAAAVFSLLRNAGIHINQRLKSTLEIESASNDPMAIFLTVGLLEVLVNKMAFGTGMLQLFFAQMGIGALVGLGVGWIAVKAINRINLMASGLYPVMVTALGLLSFGFAAHFNGSGFLAIFITGVIVGNSRFVAQRSTFLFHDGLAWLSQITMFVVLGLLINPTELLNVWVQGLLIALVLIFIARPLVVAPTMRLFGFNNRETALVSWVGLRGSVPIILAIFPLMYGLENAPLIFNVVFFVVLISAMLQGSTLSVAAKALGLAEQPPAAPAATLEITSLHKVAADIVNYTIGKDSRAIGRSLAHLALPEGSIVAMISRGQDVIPPRGSTVVQADDNLFFITKSANRTFLDLALSPTGIDTHHHTQNETLRLKGTTRISDIEESYNIQLEHNSPALTLDQLFQDKFGLELKIGDSIEFEQAHLSVLEMVGRRTATVGVTQKVTPKTE